MFRHVEQKLHSVNVEQNMAFPQHHLMDILKSLYVQFNHFAHHFPQTQCRKLGLISFLTW